MSRPDTLPDFSNPPLNEVVLGVQFSTPRGYQQIRAYEVWQLYREQFPTVEEQPPLAPTFETFGLPSGPQLSFNMTTGAQHDRFWFLSPNKDELIQFQDDRILHNWRKVGDMSNEYPRFERMVVRFEEELRAFDSYVKNLASQTLNITQCEISYINHIYLDGPERSLNVSDVFRFAQFSGEKPEDFSSTFRRTISDADGAPIGRLHSEVQTGLSNLNGQRVLVFTLTARGAPSQPTIPGALEFLKVGREMVVNTFTDLTTDSVHEIWGRKL
ncbi:hypothetical protein ASE36_18945 [Rhizobium sp. Root274]|uniref:TIGR04255 family protein n=1 Tax=unclassified Rhizobium TaxID=2613769 RepID=UPI0007143741|nr:MULTISPECIES: TIGR04255 family protein [unclassified Rhizobium]KQW27041.1 hypothetical protein ASC71_20130 [Rhizobium sp. Root1240]KRD27897.1 hypothetical protein ASE36_18945 [Rhizobium sp. Root274]